MFLHRGHVVEIPDCLLAAQNSNNIRSAIDISGHGHSRNVRRNVGSNAIVETRDTS